MHQSAKPFDYVNNNAQNLSKKRCFLGGWKGYREFVVSKKVEETPEITSFYLKSKDGQPISSFCLDNISQSRFNGDRVSNQFT
jgi:hypothetical protein